MCSSEQVWKGRWLWGSEERLDAFVEERNYYRRIDGILGHV